MKEGFFLFQTVRRRAVRLATIVPMPEMVAVLRLLTRSSLVSAGGQLYPSDVADQSSSPMTIEFSLQGDLILGFRLVGSSEDGAPAQQQSFAFLTDVLAEPVLRYLQASHDFDPICTVRGRFRINPCILDPPARSLTEQDIKNHQSGPSRTSTIIWRYQ